MRTNTQATNVEDAVMIEARVSAPVVEAPKAEVRFNKNKAIRDWFWKETKKYWNELSEIYSKEKVPG